MAEPIRSALFVDYESLHRSLAGVDARTDVRLAARVTDWTGAIESGRLIGPEGTARRLVARRCYAGPSTRGKQRDAFAAAGFTVVDVGAESGARSPIDMHLAMDTIDAISGPDAPDEFIILSAGAEFAPLLTRLHSHRRTTAIYVDAGTTSTDKSLANATLAAEAFAEFLVLEEKPDAESTGIDRAQIEAFARRIHAATNIPLFSPKTFAELFHHLTEEIRENGYHFQSTARNVAERMATAGRNVTRRQIVFIVKGLALKGHVFSTGDTPEGLAEVFREQARYLITNAGIVLDEKQEVLLNAWFRAASPPAAAHPAPAAATPIRPKPPAPAPQKPATAQKPAPVAVKPVELPRPAPKTPAPAASVARGTGASSTAREEAKAVIAARIAASARLKPARTTPVPAKPAPKPPHRAQPPAAAHARSKGAPPAEAAAPAATPSPAAAAEAAPPPPSSRQRAGSDALENSILAAIAEAVDVLVEDSSGRKQQAARAATQHHAAPPPPPAPEPEDDEEEEPVIAEADNGNEAEEAEEIVEAVEDEGGDIGDQIQRIIASYNRNRAED